MLTDFRGDEAKKKFGKIKMADSRTLRFSTPTILNFFSQKIHGLVLGLVGILDAKGIDVRAASTYTAERLTGVSTNTGKK